MTKTTNNITISRGKEPKVMPTIYIHFRLSLSKPNKGMSEEEILTSRAKPGVGQNTTGLGRWTLESKR